MLSSNFRLKRDKDFKATFKSNGSVFDSVCGIKYKKNNLKNSRYAVVVGTKVHKSAVKRNKIRRQYQEIIKAHLSQIDDGYDIIMLTSKPALNLSYKEKEERLLKVLKKSGLII